MTRSVFPELCLTMRKLQTALLGLLGAGLAHGAVTLEFTDALYALNNISDGLSPGPVNGLTWGIVIDSEGDGFGTSPGITNPPDPPNDPGYLAEVGLTVSDGEFFSADDVFFYGGETTFFIGNEAGNGAILRTPSLDLDLYTGDPFAIIWFQSLASDDTITIGDAYGIITHDQFIVPPLGDVPFQQHFSGTDPIRNPDFQFLDAVPEPSVGLLWLVAISSALLRRRRPPQDRIWSP